MRRYLLYARAPRWVTLGRSLDDLVQSPAFAVRKAEGRVCAGVLALDDGSAVFVKRTETRSTARGLVERSRGSRAGRAIKGAAMLAAAGIDHPAPLAAIEIRAASGAVRTSYLVSEFLDGAQTLSVFALGRNGELRRAMRRRIAITKAVAKAVRGMHDAGLYTRDLQETNLMLKPDGAGFRIYFIDLEDFVRAGRVPMRRRFENLVHLDRSIGRFVGRAGRLRFLRDYLGDEPSDRAEMRRILVRLARMRARLDRRAARRVRREPPAVANELRSALGGS